MSTMHAYPDHGLQGSENEMVYRFYFDSTLESRGCVIGMVYMIHCGHGFGFGPGKGSESGNGNRFVSGTETAKAFEIGIAKTLCMMNSWSTSSQTLNRNPAVQREGLG